MSFGLHIVHMASGTPCSAQNSSAAAAIGSGSGACRVQPIDPNVRSPKSPTNETIERRMRHLDTRTRVRPGSCPVSFRRMCSGVVTRDVEDVVLFRTGGANGVERLVRGDRLRELAVRLRQENRRACRRAASAVATTIGLACAIVHAGGRQEFGEHPRHEHEDQGESQEGVPKWGAHTLPNLTSRLVSRPGQGAGRPFSPA